MNTDDTVKNQFGWLPVSIFKPERKEEWREIIGDDGDEATRRSEDAKYLPGLRYSEFHPHLAELVIRYWSQQGDLVLDPFAGRGTRGIVALHLGRRYKGYEISPKTYQQFRDRIEAAGGSLVLADGCSLAGDEEGDADLVFTCPPYHKLERYEKVSGQLSEESTYESFLGRIGHAAINAC